MVTDNNGGNFLATNSFDVEDVNDKPTGVVRLTGESAEDSALILDVSDVYDEDGMGPFNFTWQRTSPNTGWES